MTALKKFSFTGLDSLILIVLFHIQRLTDGYDASKLMVQGEVNKAMYGHNFLNISGMTMAKCLEHCLANCLCMSFQICGDASECQLCSSNKYSNPYAMRQFEGCTNYNFESQDKMKIRNEQCDRDCITAIINCCMTSNPCRNGGTCLPHSPSSQKRFRCKCPDGYEGERCQLMKCSLGYTGKRCEQPIKSCRGYSNGSRVPGNYTVIDGNLRPFQIFCDFDSNSSITWTLIQSYKLKNREDFRKSLFEDSPLKDPNEPSWFHYRLSKSAMKSIQKDSTQWRITCRYETDGVVYTDYVRALNTELDILTFNGHGKCVKLEYINVRGHNCTGCTAGFWQFTGTILHTDSYHKNCAFQPDVSLPCDNNAGEDNFGYYLCINKQHRCSSSDEATTQTWFGGRV